MASYEYKVEIAETVNGHVEWWGTAQAGWTHETATRWAHTTFAAEHESGARARIMRRRGPRSRWQQHRRYEVGADGIVRRTDR